MSIDELYTKTISDLKEGKRAKVELNFNLRHQILNNWKMALENKQKEEIEKCLCLLEHSQILCGEFDELFYTTISENFGSPLDIYALAASWKHIIQRRQRSGERIPYKYIQIIEKKLSVEQPEIFEWVLRTVDQLGPQSIIVKKTVLSRKPGLLKVFNPHYRMSREIIDMLEKRWSQAPGVSS